MAFRTGFEGGPPSRRDLEEEVPGEEELDQEYAERKIERLEGRLTLQAILVLVLFLSLAAFFYFDFSQRIARVEDTGATKVEDLSRQVQANLEQSSMSVDERTAGLAAALEDLKKALAANRDQTREVAAGLEKLAKAAATPEKVRELLAEQEKATAREREKLSLAVAAQVKAEQEAREALARDLAGLSARMASVVESSSGVKTSVETMTQKIAELSLAVDEMDRSKVNRALLEELLSHQQALMEAQMADSEQTAKKLELRIRALETAAGRAKNAANAPAAPAPRPAPSAAPAPAKPTGKIIEQDLD